LFQDQKDKMDKVRTFCLETDHS